MTAPSRFNKEESASSMGQRWQRPKGAITMAVPIIQEQEESAARMGQRPNGAATMTVPNVLGKGDST